MCNCREEMESKLFDELKADRPDAEQLRVTLGGYSLLLENGGLKSVPVMPINIEWMHTFKNGNKKIKKESINFALMHCPFCGELVNSKASTIS